MKADSVRIGEVFGNCIVIEVSPNNLERKGGRLSFSAKLKCKCGNVFDKNKFGSLKGKHLSCGCINHHKLSKNVKTEDPKECSFNSLYKRYRSHARNHQREFSLTKDQFGLLINAPCHYCTALPELKYNVYVTTKGKYTSSNTERSDKAWILFNGLDRIDSSKGYFETNVVTCCRTCNFAKNDWPYDKFITWLKRVGKVWANQQD